MAPTRAIRLLGPHGILAGHPHTRRPQRAGFTIVPSVEGDREYVPNSGDHRAMRQFAAFIAGEGPPPDENAEPTCWRGAQRIGR